MIVLDASAAVDAVLDLSPRGDWVADRMARAGAGVHAPHLIDLECMSTFRRRVATGELSTVAAREAIGLLEGLPIIRYPHTSYLEGIWSLRDRITIYDAAYVALAQALDATVITTDRRLGRAGLGDRVVAYPA